MKWIKRLEEKQKKQLQKLSKRQRKIGFMIGLIVGTIAGACAIMKILDADFNEVKETCMLKFEGCCQDNAEEEA